MKEIKNRKWRKKFKLKDPLKLCGNRINHLSHIYSANALTFKAPNNPKRYIYPTIRQR